MSETVIHAAGPWRYDVENSEADTEYWLAIDGGYTSGYWCSCLDSWRYGSPTDFPNEEICVPVIAFSVINPPETKP